MKASLVQYCLLCIKLGIMVHYILYSFCAQLFSSVLAPNNWQTRLSCAGGKNNVLPHSRFVCTFFLPYGDKEELEASLSLSLCLLLFWVGERGRRNPFFLSCAYIISCKMRTSVGKMRKQWYMCFTDFLESLLPNLMHTFIC